MPPQDPTDPTLDPTNPGDPGEPPEPPAPTDPPEPPPPPAPTQTIGQVIDRVVADRKALDDATASQAQIDQAVASATSKVDADNQALASALKQVGDIVTDNGDGTFTGYFADSSPQGFHTEVLHGPSTPIPAS